MTNFFKKAISNLSVASINIRTTSVSIHDFVENYDFSRLEKEGYKGVEKVKLVRSEADGDEQKKIWWEFHFSILSVLDWLMKAQKNLKKMITQ